MGEVEMGQKMRLVCPECAAQYEVDAAVIPESGRDVQCSNCDNTWWQMPTGGGVSQRSEAPRHRARNRPERPEPIAGELTGGKAAAANVQAASEAPVATAETSSMLDAEDDGTADEDLVPPTDAQRRSLDEAVLSVLRQEAEREASARRAEGGGLEAQGEFGLDRDLGRGAGEREAAVHDRMAAIGALAGEDALRAGSKLPNVDEITSSLHGRGDVEGTSSDAVIGAMRRRRAGFRLGFTLTLAAAIAVIAAYSFSDRIVAQAPGLEPSMAALTRSVDSGRLWLESAAQNATLAIKGVTQGEN